jgi:hypothetical protein
MARAAHWCKERERVTWECLNDAGVVGFWPTAMSTAGGTSATWCGQGRWLLEGLPAPKLHGHETKAGARPVATRVDQKGDIHDEGA